MTRNYSYHSATGRPAQAGKPAPRCAHRPRDEPDEGFQPCVFNVPPVRKCLRIKDELAGKRIKCPGCGHVQVAEEVLDPEVLEAPPASITAKPVFKKTASLKNADAQVPLRRRPGATPCRMTTTNRVRAAIETMTTNHGPGRKRWRRSPTLC